MIGLAVLYFIYTICNKFYHHTTTHALWICTIGIIILIGTLFSDHDMGHPECLRQVTDIHKLLE